MPRWIIGLLLLTPHLSAQKTASIFPDSIHLKAMEWRNIGPFRGGRSIAVAGHTREPLTYYFGATGGGVWKTVDGGITWLNVSDGFLTSSSVGALEVAPSDPNVVYAGTGESCIRGNISPGDGLYRSVDAGKTWSFIGLRETRFISRIAVDPNDANVVYVAALGQVFGRNKERGVYRSTDGGRTWSNVLYVNDQTGAVDIAIDPHNPRVLYAAMWEAYRNPWSMSSGGPGSGLYKSTDGGSTWINLSQRPGMPKGVIGKIGVSASPVQANRVYAIVEAEHGGVFRSDDAGETWQRVNDDRKLRQRAWYYSHIYADPKNPDAVYALNVQWFKSVDGGKTFTPLPTQHGDHHDLWIDPENPDRLILADDGGAVVSMNGGQSLTDQDLSTSQFYHVILDNAFPYNVYGAQQDNSTIKIPSRTTSAGIEAGDWHPVAGGESGYIAVHPLKPGVTYGGSYMGYLTRHDERTKQERIIMVWPDNTIGRGAIDAKYRFQWTYPIALSPHDPNILYVTSQYVHRSTDEGQTWLTISPDLTRNDTTKQKASGGPITKDNTGVEFYNTIFSFTESPVTKGILWAGSDDGLIHVSRDDGKTWQNVTPKDMPEWSLISMIEASPWDAATVYVASNRYKLNDFTPFLWKSTDYGKSWKRITAGIPNGHFTRVIREDPNRKGLLYAGTERGIYVSFNDGDIWRPLQLNLPQTPIHDLAVHKRDRDLVAATHGRGFWILDDLTPLHQMSDAVTRSSVHLYAPRSAYRTEGFQYVKAGLPLGTNPPNGVLVHYQLNKRPAGELSLEFLDDAGHSIARFSSIKDTKGKNLKPSEEFYDQPKEKRMDVVPADSGLNRFVWDMRYKNAEDVPDAILWWGDTRGPRVAPGRYSVKLSVEGQTFTQSFEILKDPRIETTRDEFVRQSELLAKIHTQLDSVHKCVIRIRRVQKQLQDFLSNVKDTTLVRILKEFSKPLTDSLTAIENALIQPKIKSSQDILNFPLQLNNRLATLAAIVGASDHAPTQSQLDLYVELERLAEDRYRQLDALLTSRLPAFNDQVREKNIPVLSID